jgi:hypothetical protein
LNTAALYRDQLLKSGATDAQKARVKQQVRLENALIVESIALRPTQEGLDFAIEQGMDMKVEQPYLLPFNRDTDPVHEYIFSIEGRKFKLHVHYPSKDAGVNDVPVKAHYKRYDEAGGDDDDLPRSYYADDRRAKLAYRSEEAHAGIETARQFLPAEKWGLAKLPDRSSR